MKCSGDESFSGVDWGKTLRGRGPTPPHPNTPRLRAPTPQHPTPHAPYAPTHLTPPQHPFFLIAMCCRNFPDPSRKPGIVSLRAGLRRKSTLLWWLLLPRTAVVEPACSWALWLPARGRCGCLREGAVVSWMRDFGRLVGNFFPLRICPSRDLFGAFGPSVTINAMAFVAPFLEASRMRSLNCL